MTALKTLVSIQIHAHDTQAAQTLTYSAVGLPAGLAINPSTGLISGRSGSTTKSYTVLLKAIDTTGASGTAALTWTIKNAVTVTPPGNRTTAFKKTVRVQIHVHDTQPGQRFTYSAKGLPSGLKINPTTGLISGRVGSKPKRYAVLVTVTDSSHSRGSTSFSWTVRR
jgi:hypothetical protein